MCEIIPFPLSPIRSRRLRALLSSDPAAEIGTDADVAAVDRAVDIALGREVARLLGACETCTHFGLVCLMGCDDRSA